MTGSSFFKSLKQCSADAHPITCNFDLYTNATNLTSSQKLAPNTDITGKKVTNVFIATTCLAVFAGLLLILDEYHLLHAKKKLRENPEYDSIRHHFSFYRRLLHTIDTLLHHSSDLQLIAGLSLLFVTFFSGCTISAYHYNVVCLMLLMSLITHTIAIATIPKFFAKHGWTSVERVGGIVVTIAFTWYMFKSRDLENFPTQPSSLAIMPGSCFAQDILNGSLSFNISELVLPSGQKTDAAIEYEQFFLPIAITLLIGMIFFGCASTDLMDRNKGSLIAEYILWGFRCVVWIIGFVFLIVVTYKYTDLRDGMEVSKWFLVGKENPYALCQILSCAMLASSSFAILKACQDTIDGPRGEKAFNVTLAAHLGAREMRSMDDEGQVGTKDISSESVQEIGPWP